jgi:excisionase family DNA binding protein
LVFPFGTTVTLLYPSFSVGTLIYHLSAVNISRERYHLRMERQNLLTLEQAAERLGMKPVTLRMWASARKIARVKIGRAVRIPEGEIARIIERGLIPALPDRLR